MGLFDKNNIPSFSIQNAMETTPAPLDVVFGGMLSGTVGALVSPGGAGKSFLAIEIATAITGGYDITGSLRVGIPGKVTYLNAEDGANILHHRVNAISQYLNSEQKCLVAENLTICPLIGQYPWILDDNARIQQPVVEYVMSKAEGQRLIILDTMRRFHTADENSSGAMATLLAILENISKETGAAILFLHHTSKSATLNGNGDNQGASRGSSVLVDNARYVANLSRMTNAEGKIHSIPEDWLRYYLRITDSKCNNVASAPDQWLYRQPGGVLVKATFTENPTRLNPIIGAQNANNTGANNSNRSYGVGFANITQSELFS